MTDQKAENLTSLPPTWCSDVDWTDLLLRIQNRENIAVGELYALLSRGILFFLRRRLPMEEAKDRLHEVFLILIEAIQAGRIDDARAFPGYAVTVAKRQAWTQIRMRSGGRELSCEDGVMERVFSDGRDDPYTLVADAQQHAILDKALGLLHPRQREVLRRFYVNEQSKEEICIAMKLTETQFRLLKSRAKNRFGEVGRDALSRRPPGRKTMMPLISGVA